jgi:hypothetical protein
VISLGPNERKPRDVTPGNHSHPAVQVKQEPPADHPGEMPSVDEPPPPIVLPKVAAVHRANNNNNNNNNNSSSPSKTLHNSPTKRSKVILTSNLMFDGKKVYSAQVQRGNAPVGSAPSPEPEPKTEEHHQVNALDMLELPVVKQEPQDFTRF